MSYWIMRQMATDRATGWRETGCDGKSRWTLRTQKNGLKCKSPCGGMVDILRGELITRVGGAMSNKAAFMLAKLAPKGVDYKSVGGGGGPMLTEMDIAAACAGLTKQQELLLRAKYCGDTACAHSFTVEVWERLCDELGKIRELDYLALMRLAKTMSREIVDPGKCQKCRGTGHVQTDFEAAKQCPSCGGGGDKSASQRQRARQADIPESTWRHQGLNEVYNRILDEWIRTEADGLRAVSRRLAG